MPLYRIADLNILYTPQSDYAAAFLAEYESDAASPDLTVSLSPSAIAAEEALSASVSDGVREVTALQRELHRQFPEHDRLLLHAATVMYRTKAYAFIAPSGTGKTTHVRLWKQLLGESVCIVGGDKTAVAVGTHEVTAYGMPWKGKERLGDDLACELGGVLVLTRCEQASCVPISASEALPSLLQATGYVGLSRQRQEVLSLLERLCRTVPLYHVYAPESTDAVKAVLSQIGGSYED